MLGLIQVIFAGRRANEKTRQHRLTHIHGVERPIQPLVLDPQSNLAADYRLVAAD
jgi:hypothetical protein